MYFTDEDDSGSNVESHGILHGGGHVANLKHIAVEVYPVEYPSQAGTRIILKVKPEPVAGKPGYSDSPFPFTVFREHHKRMAMRFTTT